MQQQQPKVYNFRQQEISGRPEKQIESPGLSGRSILLVVACVVVLGAAAGWFFLSKPTGTLTVNTNAPSLLFIDGEEQGTAPVEDLALAVGTYQITIRHEKTGQEQTYEETITEDTLTELTANWRKGQKGKKIAKAPSIKKKTKKPAKRKPSKEKPEESNEPY